MSYQCALCGKGSLVGKNVSHAKNRTRKISMPNLHRFNGFFQGQKGKYLFCTKCLRKVKSNQPKPVKKEALPVDNPPKTASR
jgi:large subunit ribosomal protein L28